MTSNIGNIYGYGGNTVGGYYGSANKNNVETNKEEQAAQETPTQERVDVDPNKVLEFLAASSIKITGTPGIIPTDDAATAERVDGYIQNFEMIYNVIAQEFGKNVADTLMNNDDFIDALMTAA